MPLDLSKLRNELSGAKHRKVLRIIAWFELGLMLLVVVSVGLIVATVNTDGVHRYLLGLAQRKATEQLGVQVKLENFVLHLRTLSVDLYGIRVAGASPHENPPLLSADHVSAGVRVISVFSRKWYLDHVQVDHPVVWLLVDKDGVTNLPKLKSNGSSHTSVFDLGIRHAILDRGEIYYNDRPSALTADLHNVEFQSTFDSLHKAYDGRLAYSNARLQYGTFQPTQHDLDAEFQATPTAFVLKRAKIASGNSEVNLAASMNNYNNPEIQGQYAVKVDCGQVAEILHDPSMPSGVVYTAGSIRYVNAPDRPLLRSLTVNGKLNSPDLLISSGQVRGEVKNVEAQYSLANGDAALEGLRAALLGGELTASGKMTEIGGNSHTTVQADVRRISLAEIQRLGGRAARTAGVAMSGVADATVSANWGRTLSDLAAHADATIRGAVAPVHHRGAQMTAADASQTEGMGPLPINAVFHAKYTNKDEALRLDNSYLRTPKTNISLNGVVSRGSALTVDVQANDLHELAAVAASFSSANAGGTPMDLGGTASFRGTVRGAISQPDIAGQLNATNLHVNGSDWKVARANVNVSPAYARLQNIDLEPAQHGRIAGNLGAGLNRWSVTKRSPIEAALTASQIDIPMLVKLTGKPLPVSGTLDLQLQAHGSLGNPQGNGELALSKVTAYQQPISLARIDFSGGKNELQAKLSMRMPAGTVQGRVTGNLENRRFSAQIDSNGIDLSKLQALEAQGVDTKGSLTLHAKGSGSFDNPDANADLQVSSLTISGQSFSGLKLQANLANRILNAEMTSSAMSAAIHAKARINFTGDYLADASFDTEAIPLKALAAAFAPAEADQLSGETEVHGTLHGPLKQMSKLQAEVTVPMLKIGYSNTVQLAAMAPIRADYTGGVVHLQPATIRGTDTDLQVQGVIPVKSSTAMSLQAHGAVDLQLLQLFDPEVRSSGKLQVNINSNGSSAGQALGGEIDIVDANLASTVSPVGLQHGNGVLKVTPDRIKVTKFDGTVGGGEVAAQGAIVYRPNLQFDLGATTKGVRMLYPQGVRETINANIRLTGTTKKALLGGAVNIADLSFTPGFDLSSLSSQLSTGVAAPTQPGFAQNVALNLAVNSSSSMNLQSRTLSVGGSANLQIRGTAADPVVLGRVNLNSGDLIFNGNRFVLAGGTIQFINPSMTEPVVNVTMNTTIREYKINLRFNGPVDQLSTQYSSNPALPPADIIHLLAFGNTTEASAQNATPASQQAESLVASQVSSQVTSRISKAAGISQLSISPVLGGSAATGPPGAQLTIQQRVTGNLFITFSTNVATTQGQIIQGQYQVTPRVAVSATRDPNGGFAFDTLIRKSW